MIALRLAYRMAETFNGIVFDVIRLATGWIVLITLPNGAHVELHDFQSEAGAKTWIKVNARAWATGYLTQPINRRMMSNYPS